MTFLKIFDIIIIENKEGVKKKMIINGNSTSPYITGINYTYDYDTSTTINNGIPL